MATREEWLNALTTKLAPTFTDHGHPLPAKLRASCGWPSVRAMSKKDRRIGECWTARASADQTTEVFVSPWIADAVEVAAILVHELVHAAVGLEEGHKGEFRKLAVALGLEGKMTATKAGAQLRERLNALVAEVGPYPHASLNGLENGRKKQTTRMIKVECPACGYVVRTSAKWIEVGLPTCCCGDQMEPIV